ncbi:MAG: M24 family metallopeptidase [Bryobacteraceae bacterium]|nr:M24 family metallopeptidase [Bryobacteraceae bacterium]
MQIDLIQKALREEGLDGWLFFDHHHRDPIAYRVLQFSPTQHVTRRWYYLIPAHGEPRGLGHQIEPAILDPLPGDKRLYAGWKQQREFLAEMLKGLGRVAMQYSPECAVPYVGTVDAGTVELVRTCGVDVASSANLVQLFEARWSEAALASHREAQKRIDAIRYAAFDLAGEAVRAGREITEYKVQQFILDQFRLNGMTTGHGPIVAVNANASNPHYEPSRSHTAPIRKGDLLLIDLWAKMDRPGAVYYDITWTAYCGATPPAAMQNVFSVVARARDAAIALVQKAASAGEPLAGYQVDDAAREVVRAAGFGECFFHRTGHSIGEEVHGNGANMDNYETHDARSIIPRTAFSIEPGIYLPEFGIRSEVNVYRGETRAEVTGEKQERLLELLQ